MPRKRQPQSLLTKPASTAPAALSSARAGTSQYDEQARNVNDLLLQLRVSQRTHVLPQPATMASVHPSVREHLFIPDSVSPRPRPDMSTHQGPTRERRIPGPPPPQSWLLQSKYAIHGRKPYTDEERTFQHQSVRLPGVYLPENRSLQHCVLKIMASTWYSQAQHVVFNHTLLPLRLRDTLLSYISIFAAGDEWLTDRTPLQVLFPIEGARNYDTDDDDDRQELSRLDLTNALGIWLSWSILRKTLLLTEVTEPMPSQIVPPSDPSTAVQDFAQGVPDSWEDAMEVDRKPPTQQRSVSSSGVPRTLHTLRYPNLRHLSLGLDPKAVSSTVSWSNLLGLANHLHTLESLSLAYWPLPTYTPVAAATFTTVTSSLLGTRRRIAYGGTNMYSAQENDWRESAGILRSLSRSLYCLKWLDLSGCVPWLPALVWEDDTLAVLPHDGFGPRSYQTGEPLPVSIWNGHWRGIEWLGLGVGWAPPAGIHDVKTSTAPARDYSELRMIADRVGQQVCASRRVGKGQKINIDWGDDLSGPTSAL